MNCRECRLAIDKGEKYMVRQGDRFRLVYHKDCFIRAPDPESMIKEMEDRSKSIKLKDKSISSPSRSSFKTSRLSSTLNSKRKSRRFSSFKLLDIECDDD